MQSDRNRLNCEIKVNLKSKKENEKKYTALVSKGFKEMWLKKQDKIEEHKNFLTSNKISYFQIGFIVNPF